MTQKHYGLTIVWLALAALLLLMVYGYVLTGRLGNVQVIPTESFSASSVQKAAGLVPEASRVAADGGSEEPYYSAAELPVAAPSLIDTPATATDAEATTSTLAASLDTEDDLGSYYKPIQTESPFVLPALAEPVEQTYSRRMAPTDLSGRTEASVSQREARAAETALLSLPYDKIRFQFNSRSIARGGYAVIQQAAEILKKNPQITIKIVNYTDSFGDDNYNLDLSRLRAKEVYQVFIDYGVERQQLSYQGLGESNPVADNATLEGRRLNRRTEIQLAEGGNL